jgi:hypothetical protein
MASITFYNTATKDILDGTIDLDTDTIKVSLHSSTYTPSVAHDFHDDITNEMASGGGYTTGGETLGSTAVTTVTTNDAMYDAADVTWSSNASGFSTARYAVIYKSTGTASTSPLVGYIDFVSNQDNVNNDLTIQWNTSGILQLTT